VLYHLSYGPLDDTLDPASGEGDGQGRNRTADTVIFSHVLYQLSYLARQKNRPAFYWRGREPSREVFCYSPPAPARPRGLHVSASVQDRARDASKAARADHARQSNRRSVIMVPPRWPPRRKHVAGGVIQTIAGAGFEPATFGL